MYRRGKSFDKRYKKEQKLSIKAFLIEELIMKSWWLLLFLVITGSIFSNIYAQQNHKYTELKSDLDKLIQAEQKAKQKNLIMRKEIESIQDPDYIELLLKQELGVVPEGQIKVHFTSEQ